MLGAAFVTAIDVDPDAVENARENAVRNGVVDVVETHIGDLCTAALPPADVVTANLTWSILQRHAGDLTRLVNQGGILIAAGFTIDERDRVAGAFAGHLTVSETAEEDGWIGVVLSRPLAVNPTAR